MAKLYFRHGAMGSSKSANALMVAYNYYERGKQALLAKPRLDTRDEGVIRSRMGLEQKCIYVDELCQMTDDELQSYDCIIVDEAQFCKKSDVEFFIHIVDELERPELSGQEGMIFAERDQAQERYPMPAAFARYTSYLKIRLGNDRFREE